MTKDEALKLALEALEKLWNIIDDIDTYGDMAKDDEKLYRSLVERRQRTRFEETGITTDGYELSGGAITAIKEALANVATEDTSKERVDEMQKQRHEQEPIALPCCGYADASAVKLNPHNQVVQCHNCGQVYTAISQRTWVGLTNNDLQPIAEEYRILFGSWVHDFARAIEAKLKEKNSA